MVVNETVVDQRETEEQLVISIVVQCDGEILPLLCNVDLPLRPLADGRQQKKACRFSERVSASMGGREHSH
jgi:hypothetical protein